MAEYSENPINEHEERHPCISKSKETQFLETAADKTNRHWVLFMTQNSHFHIQFSAHREELSGPLLCSMHFFPIIEPHHNT